MIRVTFVLVAMIGMLAAASELNAQRRAPLRNLFRQLGHGWGTGYHALDPGPNSDYYSPWSPSNTPATQSENAWQGDFNNKDYFQAPATEDNSSWTPRAIQPIQPNQPNPAINDQTTRWQPSAQFNNANIDQAPNSQAIIRVAPQGPAQGNSINNGFSIPNDESNSRINQQLNQQMQPWKNSQVPTNPIPPATRIQGTGNQAPATGQWIPAGNTGSRTINPQYPGNGR